MKKRKKILVVYLLIVSVLMSILQIKNVKAANIKNVEEQDGLLVNVSTAFHHGRYVNGYYFSNIIMYMEGETTYFTMTVTNITDIEREEVYFDCPFYNEVGLEIQNIGITICALKPGASIQTIAKIIDGDFRIDAYDFSVIFAEKDLLDSAKDMVINKEIKCDKSEIVNGDSVVLQSEEKGVHATYQWFYAEEMSDAGIPIKGANSREYRISSVSKAYSGNYYYCRVWKEEKVANSKWIKLIVYGEKSIQIAMAGERKVIVGDPFTLKTKFEFNPYGYQFEWYSSDENNLSNATKLENKGSVVTITEYKKGSKYYWCIAKKGSQTIVSDAFYLEIHEIPDLQEPSYEDKSVCQIKKLIVKQMDDKPAVKLAWEKCDKEKIVILRSLKKNSDYRALKQLAGNETGYTDKNVKRGKVYYYKVVCFNGEVTKAVFQCKASAKKIKIDYLMRPVIAVTKGKAGSQKYVQIVLKKYEGEYVDIYMKGKSGYSKLKMEKGKNLTSRKKYRFRYEKGKVKILFRVRTYRNIGGKKYYSRFSKALQIKI